LDPVSVDGELVTAGADNAVAAAAAEADADAEGSPVAAGDAVDAGFNTGPVSLSC